MVRNRPSFVAAVAIVVFLTPVAVLAVELCTPAMTCAEATSALTSCHHAMPTMRTCCLEDGESDPVGETDAMRVKLQLRDSCAATSVVDASVSLSRVTESPQADLTQRPPPLYTAYSALLI